MAWIALALQKPGIMAIQDRELWWLFVIQAWIDSIQILMQISGLMPVELREMERMTTEMDI